MNSYLGGDAPTGRLVSRNFRIERDFIRFLVGGGASRTTAIRLVSGGEMVRARSGMNHERLESAVWDVRELRGRNAHLEVIDQSTGPWGHINVDRIEFSDTEKRPEVKDSGSRPNSSPKR